VSGISDELLKVAQDGAAAARPITAAEVIRLGNRRRTRTIAQRSLGGLSVVGIGMTAIFTGAVHSPLAPLSSTALHGESTLTETTSTAAGTMTVQVKYRNEGRSKVELVSATFSGVTKAAVRQPQLLVAFGAPTPPLTGPARNMSGRSLVVAASIRPESVYKFTGSLSENVIGLTRRLGGLVSNGTLQVAFVSAQRANESSRSISFAHPILSAGLILTG
jgi:hypothetical protein